MQLWSSCSASAGGTGLWRGLSPARCPWRAAVVWRSGRSSTSNKLAGPLYLLGAAGFSFFFCHHGDGTDEAKLQIMKDKTSQILEKVRRQALGFDTLTFVTVTILAIPAFRVIKASPILDFFCAGVVLNQYALIRNLTIVKLLAMGTLSMEEKQIQQSIQMSINFLVTSLKKNRQNITPVLVQGQEKVGCTPVLVRVHL
ncbi:hypothetical protein ACQ4PT_055536 [Festuca glaucescens]